jgi:hypothetical protein
LVRHRSAVGDFYHEEDIKGVYYCEAARLLQQLTHQLAGANRVHFFDHTVRRRVLGEDRRACASPLYRACTSITLPRRDRSA